VSLGLAGAENHQDLGPVECQHADRDAGAGAQRFESLDVLADTFGKLTAGQRGVAEEQHRPVLVALERAHEQMAVMGRVAQQLVTHRARLERVAICVCYPLEYPDHHYHSCSWPLQMSSSPGPCSLSTPPGPPPRRWRLPPAGSSRGV